MSITPPLDGLDPRAADILRFWTVDIGPPKGWFSADHTVDETLRARYAAALAPARDGAFDDWLATPAGALALVLLLDQFPRHIHRGAAEAFAYDAAARRAADIALARGFDQALNPALRVFFYLPFSHSESAADQARAVALCEGRLGPDSNETRHARAHREVIAEFGRFPYRNAMLGRGSTPQEQAFLAGGGYNPLNPGKGPSQKHRGEETMAEAVGELSGKVAVVTGSTSGIGEGCARELAKAGAKVVINDHLGSEESRAKATAIADETGAETAYIAADMSKGADCVRLVEEAAQRFGAVDILVNNAGIQHVEKIEDFPPEKWDLVIAINLTSSFHTIRAAMTGMKSRKWGRIINVSSAHGLTASPFKSAYVSAKHGLIGLTKTVALEGAEFGVTCNAICPGYVWTPLVEGQLIDQMRSHGKDKDWVIREVMLQRQGMKEFATTEQIGKTAVFLASSGADTITGTSISVDGGWTAL